MFGFLSDDDQQSTLVPFEKGLKQMKEDTENLKKGTRSSNALITLTSSSNLANQAFQTSFTSGGVTGSMVASTFGSDNRYEMCFNTLSYDALNLVRGTVNTFTMRTNCIKNVTSNSVAEHYKDAVSAHVTPTTLIIPVYFTFFASRGPLTYIAAQNLTLSPEPLLQVKVGELLFKKKYDVYVNPYGEWAGQLFFQNVVDPVFDFSTKNQLAKTPLKTSQYVGFDDYVLMHYRDMSGENGSKLSAEEVQDILDGAYTTFYSSIYLDFTGVDSTTAFAFKEFLDVGSYIGNTNEVSVQVPLINLNSFSTIQIAGLQAVNVNTTPL